MKTLKRILTMIVITIMLFILNGCEKYKDPCKQCRIHMVYPNNVRIITDTIICGVIEEGYFYEKDSDGKVILKMIVCE